MENHDIAGKAARELIILLRTAKRQTLFLRAARIPDQERKKLVEAMDQIMEMFKLFKT